MTRILWQLLRPWHRPLVVALAATVGAAACSVTLAGTAAWLIATAAGRVPILTLMVAIVGVRACGIGRGVLRYLERLAGHDAVLRMFGAVRRRAVIGVAARIRQGRLRLGDADALARIGADVDDLQDAVLRGLLPFAAGLLVSIGAATAALLILPSAGLLLATLLAVAVIGVPTSCAAGAARREAAALALRGDRDRQIGEILAAADDLLITGAWDGAVVALQRTESGERRLRVRQASATGWILAGAILTTGVCCWAAAGWGSMAVTTGRLDPVLLAVLVLLPLALTDLVAAAGECGTAIGRTAAAISRVLVLLDGEAGEFDGADPNPSPDAAPVIALHRVSARWPGSEQDALHEVDLELRAGRRIVVVGPSGSGKSTLIAVLLGLLPIRSGHITVDGRPLRDSDELRSLMSWVPADPHLFDSTIDRNIRLGRPQATDDDVEKACAAAGLTNWLTTLPEGLRTRVGDRALAVSGGERQRIALARAILADRPVLLADEPAAHLDGPTARSITAALLAQRADRCTLLVTHRPADLDRVDAVLTLTGDGRPAVSSGGPKGDQPANMLTRPPVTSDTAM